MITVEKILKVKGKKIISILPEKSVYDALELMAEKNIAALLVIDADEKLVGIITERDYARKVILEDRNSKETKVSEIMTRDLITIKRKMTLEDCMQIMTKNRVRHLPVLRKKKLIGLISIGDIVKATISEQKELISRLQEDLSHEYYGR